MQDGAEPLRVDIQLVASHREYAAPALARPDTTLARDQQSSAHGQRTELGDCRDYGVGAEEEDDESAWYNEQEDPGDDQERDDDQDGEIEEQECHLMSA